MVLVSPQVVPQVKVSSQVPGQAAVDVAKHTTDHQA